jgi:hypothetical protein
MDHLEGWGLGAMSHWAGTERRLGAFGLICLLAGAGLHAGVTVVVAHLGVVGARKTDQRAHSGDLVVFQALVQGFQKTAQVRWTATGGATISAEGLFTAPEVLGPTTFWVRATSVEDSVVSGEAFVAVLPVSDALLSLAAAVGSSMGPEVWTAFNARNLPFLDLETGHRYGPPAQVKPAFTRRSRCRPSVVGYGLPARLRLAYLGHQARGHLLSLEEGDGVSRYDLADSGPCILTVRGKVKACRVESLYEYDEAGHWGSVLLPFDIQVRGVVPFAGNVVTDEVATVDGQGLSARFESPAGLALVGGFPREEHVLVVSDDQSHVLRSVTPGGRVVTVAGKAGEAGFKDGMGGEARFNAPCFLATRPGWPGVLVSDSGNHAIRLLREEGSVITLAGDGTPGHVDSLEPFQARFRSPQGVAWGRDGTVFVADAGNECIRIISPKGKVSTLTGPKAPGGPGRSVLLRDLRGILARENGLYALNGHQLVHLAPDGRMEPIVGKVDTPGFGPGVGGADEACLNDPRALAGNGWELLIADRGNQALRRLRLGQGAPRLETVAGGPGPGATRWGLLRDDLPGALPPDYATLDHPRGLACQGDEGLYVISGRCIAEVSQPGAASAEYEPPAIVGGGGGSLQVRGPRSVDGTFIGFWWFLDLYAEDPRAVNAAEPLHQASGSATAEDRGALLVVPRTPAPGGTRFLRLRLVTEEGFTTLLHGRLAADGTLSL